jgi:hypothetical protein
LIDIPENQLSEETKKQRDHLIQLGHKVQHLVVCENGQILFDPALVDAESFSESFNAIPDKPYH